MIKYAAGFLLILASCTPYREIEVERSPQKLSTITLTAPEYLGDRGLVEQIIMYGNIPEDSTNLDGNINLLRRVVFRNYWAIPMTSGRMSARICIDREGKVIYAETIASETTFRDRVIRIKVLDASLGYKFEKKLNAPPIECGKLSFVIENNTMGRRYE